MKSVEQQNIKKICNFYVSDVHLSVMLIPYINNEINEDVEIATIFEKTNKENFEKIVNKLNVKNKEKILNINWFNEKDTKEKFNDNLKCFIKENKRYTFIISGSKKYILNINKKINNFFNSEKHDLKNVKIIDCYNIEEVGNEMKKIVINYNEILNTLSSIKDCG